ncbi:MAG: helix-turn-helix domain containing protein [Nitrospira sp.]|nr:helix-turn-helix domain containing protein [Nitrospira sp.]
MKSMTSGRELIRARLAILTLADELKNVVKACRLAGVSRSHFYAMKKAYEAYGHEGLAPRVRRKPTMPNRTPAAVEKLILSKTRDNPTVSYIRLAGQIQRDGISVTPGMVRYVWQREGLSTRSARVQWVKKNSRQGRASSQTDRVPGNKPTDHSPVATGSIPASVG